MTTKRSSIMRNPSLLSIICGIAFGAWPVIAKSTKLHSSWITVLISVSTALVVYLLQVRSTAVHAGNLTIVGVLVLLGLGALNGLGIFLYGKLITLPITNTSSYIAAVFVITTIVTVIAGWITGEPMTTKKIIGVMLGIGAIWFLNK